jgi:2-(1,2-epoxy-1,2-dihydrophenyl)acetyl-CoA isomerase
MSYDLDLPDLKCEKDGSLLWLSLNRPDFHNAISIDMIASLGFVLELADYDPEIRVVILSGEGKSFCAGGDLEAMENRSGMFSGDSFELAENYRRYIQKIPKMMESFRKPLVAMVNGAAVGAGCDLACMCDLRIASDKAKFSESFAKLSLVPGDGGTFFLQRVVGYAKAMEMSLLGDFVGAEEAKKIGLVSFVVDSHELRKQTKLMSLCIADKAPAAISFTKAALKMAYEQNIHQHLDVLSAYQGISQRTQDHREALLALKEKRPPVFIGK